MNNEFYSSPAFLNAVAASVVALLGISIILFAKPAKKNYRLVVDAHEDVTLLTARDTFTFIKSLIRASRTPDELRKTMELIKGFKKKKFRLKIAPSIRNNYYEDLLIEYCEKEAEFEYIETYICKN